MPYKDKEKQREYQRKYNARNREEFIRDKCCAFCKSASNLELDHIDPKTKVHHAIWSWSKARRDAEIAKCQVLCQQCHINKTRENQEGRTRGDHGKTSTWYNRYGCRCAPCKNYALGLKNKARLRRLEARTAISQVAD